MGLSSGRDLIAARSYGSTVQSSNVRPQMSVNLDLNSFLTGLGASHDVKYGFGWRRVNATTGTLWPGNGILAVVQNRRPRRSRRCSARAAAPTAPSTWTSTSATRSRRGARRSTSASATTIRAAARCRARRRPTRRSPTLVPGLNFAGYDAPFTWNNVSPRAGLTYALDESHKTVARASYARFAGQLDSASVGYMNPSSSAGVAVYRWLDLNSDHLALGGRSAAEPVPRHGRTASTPANPTAVTSANRIDPNLKAPVTQTFVAGLDRELRANLSVSVNYTYTRTTDLLGNATFSVTPRVGVSLSDYTAGPDADRHAARRQQLQRPDLHPEPGEGHGGRQRLPAHELERLLHRLPRRRVQRGEAAVEPLDGPRRRFSLNNAREHYAPQALYDTNGNPTRTITEPLVDGGQFAPQSTGNSVGQRLHQRAVAVQRERHVSGAVRHRRRRATCSDGRAIRSRCSARRRSAPTPGSRCW